MWNVIGKRERVALLTVSAGVIVPAEGWAETAAAAVGSTISGADTAWVLISSALVLAMIVPGLALFYGGLVRSKNVLGTIMHTFVILCVVSLLWVLGGYSLAFGPDVKGLIGGLDWIGLRWLAGGLGGIGLRRRCGRSHHVRRQCLGLCVGIGGSSRIWNGLYGAAQPADGALGHRTPVVRVVRV
jgi:Ammonium Transporter Family